MQPPPRSWLQAAADLKQELATHPPKAATIARSRFDALNKVAIRTALGVEQRNLCVFCERRIDPALGPAQAPTMGVRIAHWKPISADPSGALEWRNVYASCTGVWESGAKTCDESQGSADPQLEAPADRDWSTQLEFGSQGTLKTRSGAPKALKHAIGEQVWHLNQESLVAARAAAIQTVLMLARSERDAPPRPPKNEVIARHLNRLSRSPKPFVSAVKQALERWRS
jgi:uncharacterized protein (TIGR02646 family)